jgi:hypothetical protein
VTPALSHAHRERLFALLRGGVPVDTAARLTGVTPATVDIWRARSRAGQRGYKTFEDGLLEAIAEGEAVLLARISDAGRGNWRAAAWLLERLAPERYGPPTPVEVPDGPPSSSDPSETLAGL